MKPQKILNSHRNLENEEILGGFTLPDIKQVDSDQNSMVLA